MEADLQHPWRESAEGSSDARDLEEGGKDNVLDDAAHYAFSNDGQGISRAGSASVRE